MMRIIAMIVALYILPGLAAAANEPLPEVSTNERKTKNVNVTASVYRTCAVSMGETLMLGDHRASEWSPGDYTLSGSKAHSSGLLDIVFTGCDTGTKITISAISNYPDNRESPNDYWIRNEITEGMASNIFVVLRVLFPGEGPEDGTARWLHVNGGNPHVYTVQANNLNPTMKVNGALRRGDTDQAPIGQFRSSFTLYFDFE